MRAELATSTAKLAGPRPLAGEDIGQAGVRNRLLRLAPDPAGSYRVCKYLAKVILARLAFGRTDTGLSERIVNNVGLMRRRFQPRLDHHGRQITAPVLVANILTPAGPLIVDF